MFGFKFIKIQPTTYLLQYYRGKLKREGRGLAFFYFAPFTSLVAVPLESHDIPFIFNQITADYQNVSIQGQVSYRIVNPKQIAELLNFTLDSRGTNYLSTDLETLPQRVINQIQVLMQSLVGKLPLRDTLKAGNVLVEQILPLLSETKEIKALGLEVLGLSILAIKPTPEMARALEAEMRETLLQEADEAIYSRRNAAVEQERAIKENELNTEIAVENKKRQIRETQMDAERAVQEKQRQIEREQMAGKIDVEKLNKELVLLATENLKYQADAQAYTLTASMQALAGVEAKTIEALASMNMNPNQLVAAAFRDLANNADKIGHLNVSPDLLRELLTSE
jgi:regulator of protease activity HflC (stomatin/prohibitin superfamily)